MCCLVDWQPHAPNPTSRLWRTKGSVKRCDLKACCFQDPAPQVASIQFHWEILSQGTFGFNLFIVWAKSVQPLWSWWGEKNHIYSISKINSSFGYTESSEKAETFKLPTSHMGMSRFSLLLNLFFKFLVICSFCKLPGSVVFVVRTAHTLRVCPVCSRTEALASTSATIWKGGMCGGGGGVNKGTNTEHSILQSPFSE